MPPLPTIPVHNQHGTLQPRPTHLAVSGAQLPAQQKTHPSPAALLCFQ